MSAHQAELITIYHTLSYDGQSREETIRYRSAARRYFGNGGICPIVTSIMTYP